MNPVGTSSIDNQVSKYNFILDYRIFTRFVYNHSMKSLSFIIKNISPLCLPFFAFSDFLTLL